MLWKKFREAVALDTALLWISLGLLVLVVVLMIRDNRETSRRAEEAVANADWATCLLYNVELEATAEQLIDRRSAVFMGTLAQYLTADAGEERTMLRDQLDDPPTFEEVVVMYDAIISHKKICEDPREAEGEVNGR